MDEPAIFAYCADCEGSIDVDEDYVYVADVEGYFHCGCFSPETVDHVRRGLALLQLAKRSSERLNGPYFSTLTGSVHVVSNGDDWSQKLVTLPDGDTKTEPSMAIVRAIERGWYRAIPPAPQPREGAS